MESITAMDWTTTGQIERDSFSHRFCDDLCQVIISYLSFNKKIAFESVSKQFQRTIYRKQYTLIVSLDAHSSNDELDLFDVTNDEEHRIGKFSTQSLDTVLKKCPNIRRINIKTQIDPKTSEKIINLVIEHCNLLDDIVFNFESIDCETKRKFIDKFGSKLKRYESVLTLYDYNIINGCPKLCQFNLENYQFNPSILENQSQALRQLKELCFSCHSDQSLTQYLIDYNKESLRNIEIILTNVCKERFEFINKCVLKLKNIIKLKIYYKYPYFRFSHPVHFPEPNETVTLDLLPHSLKSIATNSNLIEILDLKFDSVKHSVCKTLFESINNFRRLKRLKLIFNQTDNDIHEYSVKSLQMCSNLTHLELVFTKHIFQEIFFKDIHKVLPRLQYLSISSINLSQVVVNCVSKLSDIHSVIITIVNDWNYQYLSDIYLLIENHRKIQSIVVFNRHKVKVFDLKNFFS